MKLPRATLILVKDGETIREDIKFNMKSVKVMRKLMKEGYELVDVESDNPFVVEYMGNEIKRYNEDKKKYVPKNPVGTAAQITGQTVKEAKDNIKRVAKKAVKDALNPFKKKNDVNE